ncbi:hypothetical protein AKJ65_01350 [candidate division MSBL1 archaeon SCGC-AAA259E19]|uniref:Uncharacterized protein n=1 Tax=candidate division MSBL1 archaeon SCGC-AAA259E19 TaxID=1698264 RepID=A0A133UN45_9EURY|nr:hypothetical protein AKJ65_01350 [candidate division MSBL1 archaeon SCGC-AAA259E19]
MLLTHKKGTPELVSGKMGIRDRFKESLKERSPWLAALFNVIWGLGYLYAGRKKLVGLSLLTLIIVFPTASIALTAKDVSFLQIQALIFGLLLFVSFALARDAYIETKKRNKESEPP